MENERKKIVHCVPTMGIGGAEHIVAELTAAQIEKGHKVELLILRHSDTEAPILKKLHPKLKYSFAFDESLVYQNSIKSKILRALYYPRCVIAARRLRSHMDLFDILHVHMTLSSWFGTQIFKLNPKCKVVETSHADKINRGSKIQAFFEKMWRFRHGLVFELRPIEREEFQVAHPKVHTDYIPISAKRPDMGQYDANAKRQIREKYGIPETAEFTIGQIGRLNIADRKTDKYVRLFSHLAKSLGPEYHFLLAGDGPDREIIEGMLRAENISQRVTISGWISDVAEALSVIDFYITFNVGPDCGTAGIQAALAGLPVAATQAEENYESSDSEWIYSCSDDSRLADYILNILKDPIQIQSLIERQSQKANRDHTMEAMCSSYDRFYERVLTSNS